MQTTRLESFWHPRHDNDEASTGAKMASHTYQAVKAALGGDAQPVTVIARPRAIPRNLTMTRMVCLSPSNVDRRYFHLAARNRQIVHSCAASSGDFFRHGPSCTSKPEAVTGPGRGIDRKRLGSTFYGFRVLD